MRNNDFSMQDLIDFGVYYYKILGVQRFKKTFVKPLHDDIITHIAHKVSLTTPILNSKILSTNKDRINFLNILSNSNKEFRFNKAQLPEIEYKHPEIRFVELYEIETPSKEEFEIIGLCVEYYINEFGYIDFMTKIRLFIFEIFEVATKTFSELFQGHKQITDYVSIDGTNLEDVKRSIISYFSNIQKKESKSPFIVVVSKLEYFNYDTIEFSSKTIIYQDKVYYKDKEDEDEDEDVFIITYDQNFFIEEIKKINNANNYPVRIEFFHKKPFRKNNPDLIKDLRNKIANDNEKPKSIAA